MGWLERIIDIDFNDPSSLVFRPSSEPTNNVKRLLQPEKTFNTDEIWDNLKTGDMIEICPSSQNIITNIAEVVSVSKGWGLVIDYGEDQSLSNSIRAIRKHKYFTEKEMLDNPGKADISAYVNFRALSHAIKQIKEWSTVGPMPQGFFLESMGMSVRMNVLK